MNDGLFERKLNALQIKTRRCYSLQRRVSLYIKRAGNAMPAKQTPSYSITAGTAGGKQTCTLTTSGGVRCWGRSNIGQAGAVHAYGVFLHAEL